MQEGNVNALGADINGRCEKKKKVHTKYIQF